MNEEQGTMGVSKIARERTLSYEPESWDQHWWLPSACDQASNGISQQLFVAFCYSFGQSEDDVGGPKMIYMSPHVASAYLCRVCRGLRFG